MRKDELKKYEHINLVDVDEKIGDIEKTATGFSRIDVTTFSEKSMDIRVCDDCYEIGRERNDYSSNFDNYPSALKMMLRIAGVTILVIGVGITFVEGIVFLIIGGILALIGVVILIKPSLYNTLAMKLTQDLAPTGPTLGLLFIGKNDEIVLYSEKFAKEFKRQNPDLKVIYRNWDKSIEEANELSLTEWMDRMKNKEQLFNSDKVL